MNWKRYGRKLSWYILMYHPGICLESLRKTTKTSVRIAVLEADILTRDFPKMKLYSKDGDDAYVRTQKTAIDTHFVIVIANYLFQDVYRTQLK
jgi:hypothetical protein